MSAMAEFWPYAVMLLVGFLPNEVWRWAAVLLAGGLDERSEILAWVRAVATAILAGVIAKLTLDPSGALAATPVALRLAAIAVGFAAFFALRRSVLAGVLVGEAVLTAGIWLFMP
jgi:hypothetical protein